MGDPALQRPDVSGAHVPDLLSKGALIVTVSTTIARVSYAGNGSTTTFTVPFAFLSSADLRVVKRSALGTETLLALTTHYTVSGAGTPAGGSVTLLTTPAAGETITIVRDPVILQATDYLPNDPFPAESHERALDLLTMVGQRLDDRLDRALVLGESDTAGAGAFRAGGNRITGLAPGTNSSDAVTLLQVQALITSAGGGGSGGGGSGGSGGGGDIVVPDSEVERIVDVVLADPALADLFTPLNSQYGNLAGQLLALNTSVGSINTSVATINVNLVDMQSQIDALSAISGDPQNIIALITSEQTARIAGDTALVQTLTKIGAAAGDDVSFILNMDTVKVSSTETIGQKFSGIATQFGSTAASIAAEATARAAADTATAQTIAKLGAQNGAGTAFILNLDTAYVSGTESLGQRLSGLASAVNNNSAAIASEQSVRSSTDASLSSSITTLQSTVGGHATTIQSQASTINGIQAKYTVKIDNNGYVSGYGLISTANNGAVTSEFKVLADSFKVFNGSTAVAPFEVSGGVVYIKEANIQSLQVGKLVAGGQSQFVPRAWARFYITGTTARFTRQSNMASITKLSGTGKARFTFATPMPNKYYCVMASGSRYDDDSSPLRLAAYNVSTTGFDLACRGSDSNYNTDLASLVVFGTDEVATDPPTGYDPGTDPSPPGGGIIP